MVAQHPHGSLFIDLCIANFNHQIGYRPGTVLHNGVTQKISVLFLDHAVIFDINTSEDIRLISTDAANLLGVTEEEFFGIHTCQQIPLQYMKHRRGIQQRNQTAHPVPHHIWLEGLHQQLRRALLQALSLLPPLGYRKHRHQAMTGIQPEVLQKLWIPPSNNGGIGFFVLSEENHSRLVGICLVYIVVLAQDGSQFRFLHDEQVV